MAGAEVKSDAICGAVTRAISQIASGLPIYDERMLQNFVEPCFFVIETSVSETQGLDRYCWREHRIEVSYIPKPDALSNRRLLGEWREILMQTLFEIYVDANVDGENIERLPVRAQNAECRLNEDQITYYATYRIYCRRSEQQHSVMGSLAQDINLF